MWPLAALIAALSVSVSGSPCEEARMRCAYRTGCGAALSNYIVFCNEVLAEPTTECPKECEHALIALTSTAEGKELMNCECEDKYCIEAKQRIEVCRPQVLEGAANATASCSLSQLICLADAQCATALGYYNELCRAMFHRGRKCSKKCLNSIQILRKQEKADALIACRCDGNEDYDCPKMQSNLQRLCFKHQKFRPNGHEKGHGDNERKHHHKKVHEVVQAGAANTISVRWLLVVMSIFHSVMLNT